MDLTKKVSAVIGSYSDYQLEEIIQKHLEVDYYIQDSSNSFYCGATECVYVFVKKDMQ